MLLYEITNLTTYIFDNINNKNNTNHALLWKISNFGKAE
jgi:hypothetical protein